MIDVERKSDQEQVTHEQIIQEQIMEEQIIIIGAGPAGIAATIQLRRFGFDPLVFEKDDVGGLLLNANLVENYPGFPSGIAGSDLAPLLKDHVLRFHPRIRKEEVTCLDWNGQTFIVRTDENTYSSKFVVLASGTHPRSISIPGIPEVQQQHGLGGMISYDVTSLHKIRGEHIAIIGAGDAAFDYALNLAEWNTVTILNRSNSYHCLELLYSRVQKDSGITYRTCVNVTKIIEKDDSLNLFLDEGGGRGEEDSVLFVDKLVIAIGREPELGFLTDTVHNRRTELVEEGLLYVVGDVGNGLLRQVSIAIGDGVKAAMMIDQIVSRTMK